MDDPYPTMCPSAYNAFGMSRRIFDALAVKLRNNAYIGFVTSVSALTGLPPARNKLSKRRRFQYMKLLISVNFTVSRRHIRILTKTYEEY